jgi:hypothetical protein
MEAEGLTSVELGPIQCVLKTRARWTYTADTQREMAALAVTQRLEQKSGLALNVPTHYVALTHSAS